MGQGKTKANRLLKHLCLDLLHEHFLVVGSIVGAADTAVQVVALQPAVDDIEVAGVVGLDEV